jgi:hypothetical protein
MPPSLPPFASKGGPHWRWGMSRAKRWLRRRVWYNAQDGYEYEPHPNAATDTWHRINPRTGEYQDIDGETGKPIVGSEGQWRHLK